MAVTSHPLIDLEDVTEIMPIRSGNTDHDARLRSLIKLATAQFEKHTRRHFTKQEFTLRFNTRNNFRKRLNLTGTETFSTKDFNDAGLVDEVETQTIWLPARPVDTGETFEVRYDSDIKPDFTAASTLVDDDNYVLEEEEGRLLLKFKTFRRRKALQVKWTGGYEAVDNGNGDGLTLSNNLPIDLKQAAIAQVAFLFKKFDRENIGARSNRKEGEDRALFTSISGITNEAAQLLVPHVVLLRGNS